MKPHERYASDTRTLLDLTAYELRRLGLAPGTPIAVHAAYPELLEDFRVRLEEDYPVVGGPGAEAAPVHVHLWGLEDGGPGAWPAPPGARHVLVAFRNRLSHRSLLGSQPRGLWFPALERRLRHEYRLRASWGVLGPQRVGWLAASALADRAGRHDLGFVLGDRALLAPTERGLRRYACPLGLLVGSRA